ncbi:MAG: hypothetical protein KAR42_04365 [candidate division Zixibacteria bacterium]|nr:hypothetical protein [candidate division Zixibacteria bacterium]
MRLFCILLAVFVLQACTPPEKIRPRKSSKGYGYINLIEQRKGQFESAAYLIDLRIKDNKQKFSITTEVYFSGDSIAFYGRGYLGKGAFKGNIINDVVTIFFKSSDEYYRNSIGGLNSGIECARPGEVLLYVLSLLTGRGNLDLEDKPVGLEMRKQRIEYLDGRFTHTIKLKDSIYPRREILLDPLCKDSIVVNYGSFGRKFPFYRTEDILYYNGEYNFRAKGFVREQKFNINIRQSKFQLNIPSSATLLDRI